MTTSAKLKLGLATLLAGLISAPLAFAQGEGSDGAMGGTMQGEGMMQEEGMMQGEGMMNGDMAGMMGMMQMMQQMGPMMEACTEMMQATATPPQADAPAQDQENG